MCQAYEAEHQFMTWLEKTVGRCYACGFIKSLCWCFYNAKQADPQRRHYYDYYYRDKAEIDRPRRGVR